MVAGARTFFFVIDTIIDSFGIRRTMPLAQAIVGFSNKGRLKPEIGGQPKRPGKVH